MSGNGYGYGYYPTGSQNYQEQNQQAWDSWALQQQQHHQQQQQQSRSLPPAYPHPPPLHSVSPPASRVPAQSYYSTTRNYPEYQGQSQIRRSGGQYPSAPYMGQSQGLQQPRDWRNNSYNKRPRPQESAVDDKMSKNAKKRKKPLSQNVPSKKDWTLEEATTALNVEKEYNKRFKNHSLIIKFPDLELNRDIVSAFNPAIENVHFQQPSTPRFCFVTLSETADAEKVISELNTIKFGDGHLTAEYKKDREEDQNIGPEDIDPCTLYVGNLAQEITKEDVVKMYPKGKRIDIGYAKKMKYTRYAFVSFKNVPDSVEAFKKTHSTQMYSKSLIVRFRRLHGTVGMPGEVKINAPPAAANSDKATTPTNSPSTGSTDNAAGSEDATNAANSLTNSDSTTTIAATTTTNTSTTTTTTTTNTSTTNNIPSSSDADLNNHVPDAGELNTTTTTASEASDVDLSIVKAERDIWDEEDVPEITDSVFEPGSLEDEVNKNVVPQVEVKRETEEADSRQVNGNVSVKTEPEEEASKPDASLVKTEEGDDESSDEDLGTSLSDVNFGRVYQELEDHSNQIEELRRIMP